MRLHHLAHEVDVGGVGDLQQHDGQVAGNGVAPKPRLSAPVAHQHRRVGAQRRVGEQHRRREARVQLGVGLGRVELTQHHLTVRPGQIDDAIGQMAVEILVDQRQRDVAAVRHAGHDVQRDRLTGIEREHAADGDHRIEHRAVGARQRGRVHRQCIGAGTGTTDEAHAVGFARHLLDVDAMYRHQVQHPRRLLAVRARTPGAQDGRPVAQDFGLHEQIAERRVQCVGGRRGDHHLGIAGDVDAPACRGPVGDAHAAQFDVVLGRHDDFRMRLELAFAVGAGIASAELGPAFGEDRLVGQCATLHRLVRGRPHVRRAVGDIQLAQIAEAAAVVAGAVLAPARDRQILPAAVAAAGLGHHDVIAAVGQQLHLGYRRVRRVEHADRRLRCQWRRAQRVQLGRVLEQRGGLGDAFVQQQHDRLEQPVGRETPLHRTVEQQRRQRKQAHALVVRHEGPHDDARLAASLACRRVVDGLEEAVAPDEALPGHPLQVGAGLFGRHQQGEHRRIGRDHQIVGQTALETQARHTEGAVLVVQVHIDRVVAGLRNAPGHAALPSVLDLPRHRGAAGLVEQRAVEGRHHQHRHQILEHRSAPGEQHRLAAGSREQAPEREPALLRQLSLGDGNEAAQARLGGQQIVIAAVGAALRHVVADGQQMTRAVVQEVVIHARQTGCLGGQRVEPRQSFARPAAAFVQMVQQRAQPGPLLRRALVFAQLGAGGKPAPDVGTERTVQAGQRRQRRHRPK